MNSVRQWFFLIGLWRAIFRERIRCLAGVLIFCFTQSTGLTAEPFGDFETIRLLPTGAGRTGREFSCKAVVTYYNDDWPICFLQDATGGSYVHMDFQRWKLKVGDLVQAEGVLHEDGLPTALTYTVLGSGTELAEPKEVPLSSLAQGIRDGHRVKVTGWLAGRTRENGHHILQMRGQYGEPFRAAIPESAVSEEVIQTWLGGRLDLTGVCGTDFDSLWQHIGFRIWVPAAEYITPHPPDFSSPEFEVPRPIAVIRQQNSGGGAPRRFRFDGVVTLQRTERSFYLQDATGGVLVETLEPVQLTTGMQVTVFGIEAMGPHSPFLKYARVQIDPEKPRAALAPAFVTAGDLLAGNLGASLVSVEGRVISTFREPGRNGVILAVDEALFSASVDSGVVGQILNPDPGSTLRVTGVCEVKVDQERKPRTFEIQAAGGGAFVLVQALPWWTLQRMLVASGVGAGLTVLSFAWVATLRRRVSAQTRRIEEQMDLLRASEERHRSITESVNEGLLITDLNDVVLEVNPQMLLMTGYSREELIGQSAMEILVPPADRPAMVEQNRNRAAGEGAQYEQRLRRKDGSEFWALIIGSPMRDARGTVVGTVGANLDITERKRAEIFLQNNLSEKETLLREVHHRVKNNLQVISSLLYFQQKKSSSPEIAAEFRQSRERVAAIALVHERLYQSGDLSQVDFIRYLRDLAGEILLGAGNNETKVRIEVTGESFALGVSEAVPCALIVNELIANALKHAFRGRSAGAIEIHLSMSETGVCRLRVADDGVGMPPGSEHRSDDSFGLRLVARLVAQLQGTFQRIEGNSGTGFLIEFQKPS